ncbi:hypothetical protein B0H10DRAFT_2235997 [Mycena sp. CBHHK59/15]|nr:hypothetical protein B0H10DRAFT_2235997 [Mycena sp. CBHHK59/15]
MPAGAWRSTSLAARVRLHPQLGLFPLEHDIQEYRHLKRPGSSVEQNAGWLSLALHVPRLRGRLLRPFRPQTPHPPTFDAEIHPTLPLPLRNALFGVVPQTTTVPATLREHTPALAAAAAAVKTLSHATLVYPASALRFQQPYATSRMSIFHSHLRAPARAVLTAAAKSAPRPSNLPRRRCLTVTTISPLDPHRPTLRAALPSLQRIAPTSDFPFHERSLSRCLYSFPFVSSSHACEDHARNIKHTYGSRRTTPSLHLLPSHNIALLLSSLPSPHRPSPDKSHLSHAILDARTACLYAYLRVPPAILRPLLVPSQSDRPRSRTPSAASRVVSLVRHSSSRTTLHAFIPDYHQRKLPRS